MTRPKSYQPLPHGRPPALTKAMVKEAVERAQAGERLTRIAAEYGVHRNTLYTAVRHYKETSR